MRTATMMDKDMRISQTPGAIFELQPDGTLEMRGNLPASFLIQLAQSNGAWQFINAVTHGMYYSPELFNEHTTYCLKYEQGVLTAGLSCNTQLWSDGVNISAEDLTVEQILEELSSLWGIALEHIRKNPRLGRRGQARAIYISTLVKGLIEQSYDRATATEHAAEIKRAVAAGEADLFQIEHCTGSPKRDGESAEECLDRLVEEAPETL